jgi:4-methylaminobutanoate oxidase (formaldehyde-forming)
MKRAEDHPLKLCGLHTLDSCRIEKAFRHFGHDISSEDHVLEAGLGFAARIGKQSGRFGDFIGRDAVLRKKDQGLNARMMQFRLKDPAPLLYHNEAVIRDGEIVGYLTSGNYGHHLGGAIGMGYVPCRDGEDGASQLASEYMIDVAGVRVAAEASLKPMYDPAAERMKS